MQTWRSKETLNRYWGTSYYDYYEKFTRCANRVINSIVTYGNFDAEDKMTVLYDYLQDAEAVIYGLEDGKSASAVIYDTESNKITEIKAVRNGNVIDVTYDATDKSFKVTAEGKTVDAAAGTTSVQITL